MVYPIYDYTRLDLKIQYETTHTTTYYRNAAPVPSGTGNLVPIAAREAGRGSGRWNLGNLNLYPGIEQLLIL